MNTPYTDRSAYPLAPNLHLASTLEPSPVPWLWPLRIPIGHLTLLVGDPGVGKSLLAADLAARVSLGAPWPTARIPALAAWEYSGPDPDRPAPPHDDQSGPFRYDLGSTIIASDEDARSAGILPRLFSAGANLTRVAILNGVYHEPPRPHRTALPPPRDPYEPPDCRFRLPEHLPLLQRAIRSVEYPRLVILDTLHSLLGPGVLTSPDTISSLLAGLAETAARFNLAILAIHHLTKAGAARTLYRIRGSIPFIAAARAAFLLSHDPASPNRRFLSTLKSIYAPDAPPLAFEIVPRLLDPPSYFEQPVDGRPPTPDEIDFRRRCDNPFLRPIPAIRWLDPHEPLAIDAALSPADAAPLPEELLNCSPASRSALLEARLWLADYLASGPKPAAPLIRQARADGHSLKTLQRAKQSLGIRPRRNAFDEPWMWSLPVPNNPAQDTSDNLDGQPGTRAEKSLATLGQNAENPVSLETLETGNEIHDSAGE